MATNAELLAQVEAALDKLLTGEFQEWSVVGRTFRRHDLGPLWAMRKELANAVAAESRGGARVRLARPV